MLNSLLSTLKPRQLEAIQAHPGPPTDPRRRRHRQDHDHHSQDGIHVEKENIAPSQILALTFSKEAARNMREKVEKLLQGKEIHVKTFHSFCAELIKDRADRCKVPSDFKIFEA